MSSTLTPSSFNFFWINIKYALLVFAYFAGGRAEVPVQYLLLLLIPYTAFHVMRFIRVAHMENRSEKSRRRLYIALIAIAMCITVSQTAYTVFSVVLIILFIRLLRLLLEELVANIWQAILLGLVSSIVRYSTIHLFLGGYFYGQPVPTSGPAGIVFISAFILVLLVLLYSIYALLQYWRQSDTDPGDSSDSDDREAVQRYLPAPPDFRTVVFMWIVASPVIRQLSAWYDTIVSKFSVLNARALTSNRFGNLFEYKQQYELQDISYWQVVKRPAIIAIFGIVAIVVRESIGAGPSVNHLYIGFTTLSVTELCINVAEMFLPEDEDLSNRMTLLIGVWILVAGGFLPDVQLARLATWPLIVVIFVYIAYRLGLLYGVILSIIGGGVLFSIESLFRLVRYLHLGGYISDLAAFLLVLIGFGIMAAVIYLMIYVLKESIEKRSKEVFYLLVGVTTWILTWTVSGVFYASSGLDIPDYYLTGGHLPIFLLRLCALLLISYALGRLYLQAEHWVLTVDQS